MKIDEFDLQLLAILKHDGRTSVTALADELHSSRHKVAYRMRRLEKLGVIHSYTCYVDFETATKGFYALIRLKVRPNKIDSVQTKIMAIKESYGIYHLTGEFNLEVLGLFENKNQFEAYLKTNLAIIQDIDQIINGIILSIYHYGRKILPLQKTEIQQDKKRKIRIDRTDLQICWILHLNARITDKAIAKQLGISPQSVSYRIKQLTENRIIPYFYARIYHVPLGSAFHAVIRLKISPTNFKAALKKVIELELSEEEKKAFKASVAHVRELVVKVEGLL